MNHVEKLLLELCPQGIQYCKLSEIAEISTGKADKKDMDPDGNYPLFVRSKTVERSNTYSFDEQAIIIPGEGNIGRIYHRIDGKYELHQRAYRIHFINPDQTDLSFAYFYFQSKFRRYIERVAVKSTATSIRKPMLEKFPFPVVPLEVQKKISNTLNNFERLEAELEAELEARRKQYQFYRDQLLNFPIRGGQTGESYTLGEVFHLRAGKFIRASHIATTKDASTPYPCYGGNGMRGYTSSFNQSGPLLLIGRQGALSGNVHRCDGEFYATEHAIVAKPRIPVDFSWSYHMLIKMNLKQYASKGAQPGLSVNKLNGLPIEIPPLQVQQEIGQVLDGFDRLIHDIAHGLPAEIVARRKQYEYYRDKLLTFPEAA